MNKPLHIQILEALQQNNAVGRFADIKYLFVEELSSKDGRKNFKDELDYLITAGLVATETSYAFLIWDTLGGLYPIDNKKISLRLTGTWETYLINKRGAIKRGEPQERIPQVEAAKVQRRSASQYTPPETAINYPVNPERQTIASAMPLTADSTSKEITPDMPEYYISAKTYPSKNTGRYSEKDADIPKVNLVFPEKEEIAPLDAAKKFFSIKADISRKEETGVNEVDHDEDVFPQGKAEAQKTNQHSQRPSDPAFIATLSKLFGSKSKPAEKVSEAVPEPAEPVAYIPEPEPVTAAPVVNKPVAPPVPRIIPRVSRLVDEEANAPFITARTAFLKVKEEPRISHWVNSSFEKPQPVPLTEPEPIAQYKPEVVAQPVERESATVAASDFTTDVSRSIAEKSHATFTATQFENRNEPQFEPAKPWVNQADISDKLKPLETSWDGPEVAFEPRTRRKMTAIPPQKPTETKSVWDKPAVEGVEDKIEIPVWDEVEKQAETVTVEVETNKKFAWEQEEQDTLRTMANQHEAKPISTKTDEAKPKSVWDEPEAAAAPVADNSGAANTKSVWEQLEEDTLRAMANYDEAKPKSVVDKPEAEAVVDKTENVKTKSVWEQVEEDTLRAMAKYDEVKLKSVSYEPKEEVFPAKAEILKPGSVWDEPEEKVFSVKDKSAVVKPGSVWDEPEEEVFPVKVKAEEPIFTPPAPLAEIIAPSAQLQQEIWVEPKLRPIRRAWPHLPETPAEPEFKHTPEPEHVPEPQPVYQAEPEAWHAPVTKEPEYIPEPQPVYQAEPEAWHAAVTTEPEYISEPQAVYEAEPEAWRPTPAREPELHPEPEAWSAPVAAPWRKPYTVPEHVAQTKPVAAVFETEDWHLPKPSLHDGPEPWPNEEFIPSPGLHQNRIFIPTPEPEPKPYQAPPKNIPHTLVPITEMAAGAPHLRDARAPGSMVTPQVLQSSVNFAANNPFADLEIIPIANHVHDAIEKQASRAWIKWAVGGIIFLLFLVAFLAYKHRYYS